MKPFSQDEKNHIIDGKTLNTPQRRIARPLSDPPPVIREIRSQIRSENIHPTRLIF